VQPVCGFDACDASDDEQVKGSAAVGNAAGVRGGPVWRCKAPAEER